MVGVVDLDGLWLAHIQGPGPSWWPADHTCELDFKRTGSSGPSGTRETTLTVTVTAENGYDDHIYSVVVARANPVDNELLSDRVRRHNADDTCTDADGYGTFDEPYTLQTDSAAASSLRLHVNLQHLGVSGPQRGLCPVPPSSRTTPKRKSRPKPTPRATSARTSATLLSVAEGGSAEAPTTNPNNSTSSRSHERCKDRPRPVRRAGA